MSDQPVFRIARPEDLDQLVGLRVRMQTEVNGPRPEAELVAYAARARAYFEASVADGTYVSAVADAGGLLVSAVGLVAYSKPPTIDGGSGRIGYISNVYTLPDWRGRGLAGALMRLIVERSRALGLERLHLGATAAGRGVYERVGFREPRFPALELKL